MQFQYQKQFYFKHFISAKVLSFNVKTVLFQVIQFSKSSLFSSIWPIDRTLSGTTTPGSWWRATPHFPNSSIIGTSPLDCLVPYLLNSMDGGGTYSSPEIMVYCTGLADWARLYNTNDSIQHCSFCCTLLNGLNITM